MNLLSRNYLIILLACVNLFTPTLVPAQTGGPIPNFLFAENAQSIVYLTTFIDQTKNVKVYKDKGTGKKTFDINDYSSMDQALWKEMVRVVTESLESAGLKPGPVVMMDMIQMQQNPDFLQDQVDEKLEGIKPFYAITIMFMDKEKLQRAFKSKKGLTPKDIRKTSLSITPSNAGMDFSKTYMIAKMNGSLEETIVQLKEDIAAKPKSYFLKNVDETELAEMNAVNEKSFEKWSTASQLTKIGKENNSFPDDLIDSEVLVYHSYMNNTGKARIDKDANNWIGWMNKFLVKFYRGKYKLANPMEYADLTTKVSHKYALVPFSVMKMLVTTETKTKGTITTSSTSKRLVNYFYYVVKNIETNEVFYGGTKEDREESSQHNMALNLKRTLKLMGKYYSWEKEK